MFKVEIYDKRIRYFFEIKEKYTILKGESGTGKTTLAQKLIQNIFIIGYLHKRII